MYSQYGKGARRLGELISKRSKENTMLLLAKVGEVTCTPCNVFGGGRNIHGAPEMGLGSSCI